MTTGDARLGGAPSPDVTVVTPVVELFARESASVAPTARALSQ
jgi:hypothetical protein